MKTKITFIILFFSTFIYSQSTWYVKAGAVGNGTTWATAAGNLQLVIDNASAGDQVWVAEGIYQRNTGLGFKIKNEVSLYGGFPNIGNPTFNDRNHLLYETILQGNQTHVLEGNGTSTPISSSTIIEGFTLTGGSHVAGAGLKLYLTNAIFKNLKITGNTSPEGMGAGINSYYSSPTFIQVLVTNNTSTLQIGYDGDAGGAYIMGGSPRFYNCVIANNHAEGFVGGVIARNTNCFFYNGIIYGNTALVNLQDSNANVNFFSQGLTSFNAANSILQGGGSSDYTYATAHWTYLYGTDLGGNMDTDPMFNTDYSLMANSPAINKGNETFYNTVPIENTDYYDNTRVVDVIDIGLSEYQTQWSDIFYVKEGGTGDGSSWQNASGDLQAMMDKQILGRPVWVAGGIYTPSKEGFFRLREGIEVYGGFPNTGNPTFNDRDINLHKTILSTNTESFVVANYHPENRRLSNETLLDGFTITRNANSPKYVGGTFDMYSDAVYSNITFTELNVGASHSVFKSQNQYINCKYINNTQIFEVGRETYGTAEVRSEANAFFKNCKFIENTAFTGSAIFIRIHSNAFIENCSFINNEGATVLSVLNSDFTLVNSIMESNYYTSQAYYVQVGHSANFPYLKGSRGIIDACTFKNNDGYMLFYDKIDDITSVSNSLFYGNERALLRDGVGTTYLTNVTITKNHTWEHSGGLKTYNGKLHVRNSIVYENTADYCCSPEFSSPGVNPADVTFKNSILKGSGGSGTNWNKAQFATWGTDLGGNLDIDPKFSNPANLNFRISTSSPAIDAGDNQFFNVGVTPDISYYTKDLAGNPRIYNNTIDIGAYEYDPKLLDLPELTVNNDLKIYPNPASEVIYVKSEDISISSIEIYSTNGKLVLTSTENYVNVSSLTSGLYLVKAFLGNGKSVSSKFIKK